MDSACHVIGCHVTHQTRRHVIKRILNPRLVSYMASYDVVSTIHQSLIEGAMPTANNMMLQVQMYGSPAAAGGIGACLFWQYALAPVLLTANISLFLVLL